MSVAFEDVAVDVEAVFDVDIAEERRVGRSRISERRSMLRDRSRALRLRSRRSFSERVLYVSLKWMAASSSLGRASRREAVDWARDGRVVLSVDRWVDESIMDLCERLERPWRERRRECVVCERDCGSLLVRDESGRVVSRFR